MRIENDKYYTHPYIAKNCIRTALKTIPNHSQYTFIEPSAGSGAFSKPLSKTFQNVIAIDIYPESSEIVQKDFLSFFPTSQNIITIGNPPFGKRCDMAIEFFNHAAKFSKYICYILPKTFRKYSILKKLDKHFHNIYDIDLPNNSFLANCSPYDVPACYQIWEYREDLRQDLETSLESDYFNFCKVLECDVAIRRVGYNAGRLVTDSTKIQKLSKNSHYFLKIKNMLKEEFIETFNKIDFRKIVNNVSGQRSLSKRELVEEFRRHYENE